MLIIGWFLAVLMAAIWTLVANENGTDFLIRSIIAILMITIFDYFWSKTNA
jgi:hypothetical protein